METNETTSHSGLLDCQVLHQSLCGSLRPVFPTANEKQQTNKKQPRGKETSTKQRRSLLLSAPLPRWLACKDFCSPCRHLRKRRYWPLHQNAVLRCRYHAQSFSFMKSGVTTKHEGVPPFKEPWWVCPL